MQIFKVFARLVLASSIVLLVLISKTNIANIAENLAHRVVREISSNISVNVQNDDKKTRSKLVLIYTNYFDDSPWPLPGMESPEEVFTYFDGSPCPFTCNITYNKKDLSHSDGVMFHNRDLPSPTHLRNLLHNKTASQRWMIFGQESPRNVPPTVTTLNGIFNWTMMYTVDADILSTYGLYRTLDPEEIPKDYINYAKQKNRLVAWTVSHCGMKRDRIVSKLIKFIPVSVYGSCSRLFPERNNTSTYCPKHSLFCSSILKKFKFYLAFENALCKDYITEKYWETPFFHDMVPIVFGSNYDVANSIPGSYINVRDFTSIEQLANYIRYLDKNDTAYNEYFKWKMKYKRIDPNWACQLCANLHNDVLPAKVHMDLNKLWREKSSCSQNEDEIVNELINGRESDIS